MLYHKNDICISTIKNYVYCYTFSSMPKNKGKGGKAHRRGAAKSETTKRELVFKADLQDYGVVTAKLGDSRFELRDTKGEKRTAHVCGQMKKKVWIEVGDIVLISIREYQTDKCDIIHKYNDEEVRELKAYGEIADDEKEKNKDDVRFANREGESDGDDSGSEPERDTLDGASSEEGSENQ